MNLELSLQINRLTISSLESHFQRLKPPLLTTELVILWIFEASAKELKEVAASSTYESLKNFSKTARVS